MSRTPLKHLLGLALVAAAVAAPSAFAGDPEAGKQKSATCEACHGPDGKGTNPMYPVIAGQYEDYLVHALKAYRDGTRNNAIMAGLAAPLSDEDIKDLAAYYAAMPSALHTLPDR
jgi:cytochrome c553